MIISILNQKGGSGKTTISINLARALMLIPKTVLLVDSDPQGSARDWHAQSDGQYLSLVGLDRPTLPRDVLKFSLSYDWILIDGAAKLSSMSVAAIRCSDVILIPVQPSPYDLWATEELVTLVKDRIALSDNTVKAAFIISRRIQKTKIGKDIKEILEQFELPVFESMTTQRVVYSTSAATGATVFDVGDNVAATEIKAIADELMHFIKT